uniref:Uncharacterized protein n=2 Tax=Gloeothece TaxID=28070 RepID=E0ULM8_GLOV7|nr:conserved hypothetical protein [Gloeothece verrucosa PCC 7822]
MKHYGDLVIEKQGDRKLVVKASIPSSLKLKFKVICVQKNLNMSDVIESLIREWILNNGPTNEFEYLEDVLNETYEDIKGYLPSSLKLEFKVLCTQKKLKIRFVITNLIQKWIKISEGSENQTRID